jgi:hypothetical protein
LANCGKISGSFRKYEGTNAETQAKAFSKETENKEIRKQGDK